MQARACVRTLLILHMQAQPRNPDLLVLAFLFHLNAYLVFVSLFLTCLRSRLVI